MLATLVGLGAGSASAQSTARPMDAGLQLLGDEPSYLDFAAGAFDIQGHRESPTSGEARVEFRFGQKFLDIGPAAGLLVTTRGGVFGYAGFYADIAWRRFVLTPARRGRGLQSRLGRGPRRKLSVPHQRQRRL